MSSIFTKIINREIPAYIIAEDDKNLAFLDINPVARGHALVVPKNEVDYLFDLPEEDYIQLNLFARKVAQAIEKIVPCQRISTAVVGLEVPHTHIHLIPLNTMSDFSFSKPKLSFSKEEFRKITADIQTAYQELD